jgi:hypothetical protein
VILPNAMVESFARAEIQLTRLDGLDLSLRRYQSHSDNLQIRPLNLRLEQMRIVHSDQDRNESRLQHNDQTDQDRCSG